MMTRFLGRHFRLAMLFGWWWSGSDRMCVVQASDIELSITNLTLDPVYNVFEIAEGFSDYEGNGYLDLFGLWFFITNSSSTDHNEDKQNSSSITTYLDFVVVPIPTHCFSRRPLDQKIIIAPSPSEEDDPNAAVDAADCDWTQHMGVGYRTLDETGDAVVWYCCSEQAIEANVCSSEQEGRLLLNLDIFQGIATNVTVPSSPFLNDTEESCHGTVDGQPFVCVNEEYISLSDAGTYVILLANCNKGHGGQSILVNGTLLVSSMTYTWQHYLYEDISVFLLLTIGYIILFIWYGWLMRQYKDSRIRLEEWILVTIVLGLAYSLVQLLASVLSEDAMNNEADQDNVEMNPLVPMLNIVGALLGGIKHALSRYLLLLLAIGWGVVHPSIDPKQSMASAVLAIIYCTAATTWELDGFSSEARLRQISGWTMLIADTIFLVWIPVALCRTINFLRRSGQSRKLERYRSLLRILGLAVFLTTCLVLLIILDVYYGTGNEVSWLNISLGNEFNFFFILVCVAHLWRPNPMARDFVYAMELSMTDDDDEFQFRQGGGGVNAIGGPLGMEGREGYLADLELTETTKPQELENTHFVGSRDVS